MVLRRRFGLRYLGRWSELINVLNKLAEGVLLRAGTKDFPWGQSLDNAVSLPSGSKITAAMPLGESPWSWRVQRLREASH